MSDTRKFSRGIAMGGSAGALALLLGTTSVLAAEDGVIAEIVVTAQKRAENLQDVPAAVSVFGEEQLARVHATQLTDYAAFMPGVIVTSGGSPGQTTITLRGIAPIGPGSVVGTYIDETPLGSSGNYARTTEFALDMMPYDVERVEVLRGPQGTLYGAGSMGGLLKYVLRAPDTKDYEFQAGVEARDINGASDIGWGARASMNAPLVQDKLALRASVFKQETPGYIDNAANGLEDENEVEQIGGRATLLWQPTENLSVKVGGTWQRVDSDNNASMTFALVPGSEPPRAGAGLGDLKTSHPIAQTFDKDVDYYSATVDWNLGWGSFVSATSYSETHTRQQQDATITFGSLYPLLTGGLVPEGTNLFWITLDLEKWTQEFRLSSNDGGFIEWRVGAFYTEEESGNVQRSVAMDNAFNPIAIFSPWFATAELPTDYEELAVFGDVTFKFSESFDLITGLRYAENDQGYRQILGGAILPTENSPGGSSEDVVTYAVSPRWHISEDTMAYLRVASGYRPGGPNVALPNVPPQVDADELTNYELGVKSQFLDGRALLNVAAFYIDWENIQQTQAFGGVSALDNAGNAESKGVEVESLFLPLPDLQVGVNLAYTDATLESSPPALGNQLGARLPLVPEWSGSLTLDYSFQAFGGRDAHVGAGYRYVDNRESDTVTIVNNLSYILPSYDVLDLNADVAFDTMTLRLFVKNVTDERAQTGGGTTVNGLDQPIRIDVSIIQPRTIGLSLDFKF